jgi:RNA polymerase sigma factor (sigma-70 family)
MAPPERDVFPPTRHSVVRALAMSTGDERAAAFDTLVRGYWRPVYAYIRLRWRRDPEEARDLTQEFFTRAFEKAYLDRYDPARARFRTFLRTCLDGFLANTAQYAARLKRGGGSLLDQVDFNSAESDIARTARSDRPDPEACFRQEWIRSLFADAIATLKTRCDERGRTRAFALFTCYDVDGSDAEARPTYAALAREFGTTASDVTNQLFWARREFRAIVLDQLRLLCGSDEEFQSEARALLGVAPR